MVKIGYRKPSLKKSIKARTTGRAKRTIKKAVIPGYGKKGSGWIKDPKRAAYNKVYNKTTKSVIPKSTKGKQSQNKNISNPKSDGVAYTQYNTEIKEVRRKNWKLILGIIFIISGISIANPVVIGAGAVFSYLGYQSKGKAKQVEKKIPVRNYNNSEVEWIISDGENKTRIFNESTNIFQKTTKPEVFFSRYMLAVRTGEELTDLLDEHEFLSIDLNVNDYTIEDLVTKFVAERDEIFNNFITRYYSETFENAQSLKTEKGRETRLINAYNLLLEYSDELSKKNVAFIKELWIS